MPELPEVETTRRGILPHIKGQAISKVIVREYFLRWPIPLNIQQILRGKTILTVERRAKYLLLKTLEGAILIHLGMSGHLRILSKPLPPEKHDHIDLIFHNNKILRLTDPRRFGAFLWIEGDPGNHYLLQHLGIEPLSRNFSGKYLYAHAQAKTVAIKSFLMNSKIVTGIGNIYAAESLFDAEIHPLTPVNKLSLEQLNQLSKMIKKILHCAIKKGGTTLKDFMQSNGKPGYFSHQLKVYGRAGLSCVRCDTILQSLVIGQRNTVYCKCCQSQLI